MQVTIPNIPTDNLYKFIAIFGILLSFGLFLYSDYVKNKIQDEILTYAKVNTEREYKLIEGYSKNKLEDMKLLKSKYLNMLEIEGAKLIVSSKNYEFYLKLRNFGSPLFLMISIIGFGLWFFKVQQYQDRILQKKSNI